jgi:hypothetical protein
MIDDWKNPVFSQALVTSEMMARDSGESGAARYGPKSIVGTPVGEVVCMARWDKALTESGVGVLRRKIKFRRIVNLIMADACFIEAEKAWAEQFFIFP